MINSQKGEFPMKKLSVLVSLTLVVLLGSLLLAPSVSALTVDQPSFALADAKTAQLVVENRTTGTLYVTLSGPKTYWFNTAKQGKATFKDIEQGKYTITVTSTACTGSLTYEKAMKGNITLKGFKCVAQRLGLVDQKVAKLTVTNQTGGTLYITLSGPQLTTSRRIKKAKTYSTTSCQENMIFLSGALLAVVLFHISKN
jgi:hypothetical protein